VNSFRKLGIGAVVTGLVLSIVTTATAERPAAAAQPPGNPETLTLVTGDQVTLIDDVVRAVTPAPSRKEMSFSVQTVDDHSYVIPTDAMRLVNSGRVDRRLFDVTTLLKFGYHDRMPLIVTGDTPPMAARSGRDLPAINGVAVEADPAGALWNELTTSRGTSKIWLDGKRKSLLDRSTAQIGAPAAWDAGHTGAGVKVAVLDTGVDQTHPDLADRELAEQNFTDAPDNVDHYGHGTHVASILAGTGAKSGTKYRGVASDAAILDGKVLNDYGDGQDSWVIAGMQWAIEQGADIVNMSLGASDLPGIDPMEEAVNTLSAQHGTLFVISAGNNYDPETIGSPASAEAALTVGAVDRADQLADFSSRGPRVGDAGLKPDLTAPGVDIVAALHADGWIGEPVEPGYTALSGTSMAAPHVAGAAALLAQQHPDWTGAQLKAALTASARPTPDVGAYEQGTGRVDVAKAIEQTVLSEPTNVNLGIPAWPHDDEPVTKSYSYRNLSAADVTLSLTLDTDAPDGMFALSANEITVPAGGTAEVTVTGDTRIGTGAGTFAGTVVATGDDLSVRTPIGMIREPESYNLTIDYLDKNGAPAADNSTVLIGQTRSSYDYASDVDGRAELRLPKGRYLLNHLIGTGEHVSVLTQPNLELTADTTVTVDARTAKPINVTPPADTTLLLGEIGFSLVSREPYEGAMRVADLGTVSTGQIGPPPPAGDVLTGRVNTQWSGADDSLYGLTWFTPGAMPTGLSEVVEPHELATVLVDVGAPAPDRTAYRMVFPRPVVGHANAMGFWREFPLPGKRVEYVNTDGLGWSSRTMQWHGSGLEAGFESPLATYRAGKTYNLRVNYGMFGPALPDLGNLGGHVFRMGDNLYIDNVSLFGDAAGNAGWAAPDSAAVRVYSGDELLGESPGALFGVFPVPAGNRDYRVTAEATHGAPFDLSTSVSCEWTFSSDTADPEVPEPQAVSVVRFHPKLDAAGAAPAGRQFAVPVLLQHNGGAKERARNLTVEASYDEGKTWTRTPVLLNTVAVLNHPADAKSVSLRASASDREGNTVKQTIIRAYHLK
jgi:subtilisin family serine protease